MIERISPTAANSSSQTIARHVTGHHAVGLSALSILVRAVMQDCPGLRRSNCRLQPQVLRSRMYAFPTGTGVPEGLQLSAPVGVPKRCKLARALLLLCLLSLLPSGDLGSVGGSPARVAVGVDVAAFDQRQLHGDHNPGVDLERLSQRELQRPHVAHDVELVLRAEPVQLPLVRRPNHELRVRPSHVQHAAARSIHRTFDRAGRSLHTGTPRPLAL